MEKCICDVCEKNIAYKNFKVKIENHTFRNGLPRREWERIDICDLCYQALVDASRKGE